MRVVSFFSLADVAALCTVPPKRILYILFINKTISLSLQRARLRLTGITYPTSGVAQKRVLKRLAQLF